MKAVLKKLINELWNSKIKFSLCILAATISMWGISSASFTYLLSERDFKSNFENSLPNDITLIIKNYNENIESILEENSFIHSFERRELLHGKIKNKNNSWMPLELYGLESLEFQTVNRVSLNNNDTIEGILIEQDAMSFFNLSADKVNLKFDSNKETVISLGGSVHDALQAPAKMEQIVYAYAKLSSIDSLLKKDRARIIIRAIDENRTKTSLNNLTATLAKIIHDNGGEILFVDVREPGTHIHQPIIDGISFLQISLGIILVIIGITLLSLILINWLVQQVPHIGIIKSIGGSQWQIFLGYTSILLIILTLGLLIGMPLGYNTSKLFNNFIARIQNFESINDPLFAWQYSLIAILSFIPPLIFSVFPIIKFTNLSVREALGKIFYASQAKTVSVLAGLIIPSTLKYSLTNVFRNGFRSYLLGALLSLGFCLYLAGTNLSYSFKKDLSEYFDGTPYQLTINLADSTKKDLQIISDQKEIKSYVPLQFIEAEYKVKGATKNGYLRIYSKNYSISKNMFLSSNNVGNCSDCIFVTPNMLQGSFANVELGEKIILRLNNELVTLRYSGVIREVFPSRADVMYWYTDKELNVYNKVAIEMATNDSLSETEKAASIEEIFKRNGFLVKSIYSTQTVSTMLINHFQPTYLVTQGIGIFTIILGLAGMLIVINLTMLERVSEIGILKALGASSNSIAGLFSLEFLSITLVSILISLPLSSIISDRLCFVYGNMVRGREFELAIDIYNTIIFILLLLVSQLLIVRMYSKKQITKTSNELLNSNG